MNRSPFAFPVLAFIAPGIVRLGALDRAGGESLVFSFQRAGDFDVLRQLARRRVV
jgi:hypothetical protein